MIYGRCKIVGLWSLLCLKIQFSSTKRLTIFYYGNIWLGNIHFRNYAYKCKALISLGHTVLFSKHIHQPSVVLHHKTIHLSLLKSEGVFCVFRLKGISFKGLAPFVQTMDSDIRRINNYPPYNSIGSAGVYPLVSDLSGG